MTPWGAAQQFVEAAARYTGDDCLLWPFAATGNGYGRVDGTRAHRVVCEKAHGPPPGSGLDAAHSCNTRLCCAPRHLRWATRQENELDKPAELRRDCQARKIDISLARTIRDDMRTQDAIAATFGISQSMVSRIKGEARWREA